MDKIVSEVEYTKKVLKDLNKNHFRYGTRISRMIINIAGVIEVIMHIMLLLIGDYEYFTFDVMLVQMILILIVVILNTNIFADISTYLFLKTDKLSLGLKSKMTFEKDKVTVVNETENMMLSYDKLYKIMETKEYIYLYINKVQALIINKENNSELELESLRNILKEKVKKYIVYMR